MKKVLYLSNIRVPYRVEFFNQLSKKCDLTVVYERSYSNNRNRKWELSIKEEYKRVFLDGIKIGNESSFSLSVVKYLLGDYDEIIIGCYSTPIGMFSNIFLRVMSKKFTINFDGEIFAESKTFKSQMKKFFIKGASKYLIAGYRAAESLKKIVGNNKKITPYYFSSLTEKELKHHESLIKKQRERYVLVVGQYEDYKGLDIAVKCSKLLPDVEFKFIGMGNSTDMFLKECNPGENCTVQPFLQKSDLEKEYQKCMCLLLPSRQECWGLVINEAASFGTPIISTYGAGAAVEFLMSEYPFLLSENNNEKRMSEVIKAFINMSIKEKERYSSYLLRFSSNYSIEKSVRCHMEGIENER